MNRGTQWSLVYLLSSLSCFLLAANGLFFFFGAWSFHMRMVGACLAVFMSCFNFLAIITTGVLRFNTMGKLAALSIYPTTYKGLNDTETAILLGEDSTYKTDGKGIVISLTLSITFCCTHCFYMTHACYR